MTTDDTARRAVAIGEQVAGAILGRRAALDRAGGQARPLFVVMAEQHGSPWQHAIQMVAMRGLARSGERVALGMEFSDRLITKIFRDRSIDRVRSEPAYSDQFHDPDGRLAQRAMLSGIMPQIAIKLFQAVEEGLPVRLNDALAFTDHGYAHGPTPMLDIDDPLARRFARAAGMPLDENHPMYLPPAVAVRNEVMLHNMLSHAADADARIYVQNVGALHMAGFRYDGDDHETWPYDQSLMGLFDRRSMADYVGVSFETSDNFTAATMLSRADPARSLHFGRAKMADMREEFFGEPEGMTIVRRVLAAANMPGLADAFERAADEARAEIDALILLRAREIGRGEVISNLPPASGPGGSRPAP